jgi:hypothetical protein
MTGSQKVNTHKRTTQKTFKKMRVTVLTKIQGEFLLLIRHQPCYSYLYSSPVEVLALIEERKYLHKK